MSASRIRLSAASAIATVGRVDLSSVIARDGSACVWCGRESWPRDLTLEHLLPRGRGGSGSDENLAVACRGCNRRRGSRPVVAFVRQELANGREPAIQRLGAALERLGRSPARAEAAYGRRQLALLLRVGAPSR